MKSQDLKAMRELPVQDLKIQLRDAEEKLFKLRFAHAVTPLKNGLEIRNLKRQRARLLTWIRQKEPKGGKA